MLKTASVFDDTRHMNLKFDCPKAATQTMLALQASNVRTSNVSQSSTNRWQLFVYPG